MLPGLSKSFSLAVLVSATPAFCCEYPDQGTMPLHRAVKRVELIPAVVEWTNMERDAGRVVSFIVQLDQPVRIGRKCLWTVDVSSAGKLWERFYVSPDGRSVRAELNGQPVAVQAWRRARREGAAPPQARPSEEARAKAP
jgi:hypothetical protein